MNVTKKKKKMKFNTPAQIALAYTCNSKSLHPTTERTIFSIMAGDEEARAALECWRFHEPVVLMDSDELDRLSDRCRFSFSFAGGDNLTCNDVERPSCVDADTPSSDDCDEPSPVMRTTRGTASATRVYDAYMQLTRSTQKTERPALGSNSGLRLEGTISSTSTRQG